jgi:hypothetical protein
MDWEEHLITLYLIICKEYETHLRYSCERFTNGGKKSFSDEEVMTVYLVGIINGMFTIKTIHRFANNFLKHWLPGLPKYSAFSHRLNNLSEAFRTLIERLQEKQIGRDDDGLYLIDSFPIALALGQHAYTAKVAPELASKSYNSTKKMYFYGVKAHVVARKREGKLADMEILMLEEAARQDGPLFDQIRPMLHDNIIFGDQAYKRPDEDHIEAQQDLKVLTPIKKKRGQKELDREDKIFSKAVSRMRQPIETLFGWLQRVTKIQEASLVRSSKGLMTHIFGRIAAAMMIQSYPDLQF